MGSTAESIFDKTVVVWPIASKIGIMTHDDD